MKPDQMKVLRRLALSDEHAIAQVMTGDVNEFHNLNTRTVALLRIAALASVVPDFNSYQSELDKAQAAGVEDEDIISALIVVAPIVGSARLSSALPHVMAALGLEILED